MDFFAELYKRKSAYMDEFLLAKAKLEVIEDIIGDYEQKSAEQGDNANEIPVEENEVACDETY